MQNLFDLNALVLGAIPMTLGLVAVAKTYMNSRYAPLASLAIGIGLVALTGIAWQAVIVQGILVGLAASGLWSGAKTTFAPVSLAE